MINPVEEIKQRKIVILLFVVLTFIIVVTYILTSINNQIKINPNNGTLPTTILAPKTTIPLERLVEFEYPLKYKNISIDYRSKSGTFIVYYQGPIETAEDMYREFLTKKGLLSRDFNVDFRSLEPISSMPHEYTK